MSGKDVNAQKAISQPPKVATGINYNKKDCLLYSVGLGITDLRYVYENSPTFAPFPTMPVVFNARPHDVMAFMAENRAAQDKKEDAAKAAASDTGIPKYDPNLLLHGEQYLEVMRPLPTSMELSAEMSTIGVHDKGKGALIEQETTYYEANNRGAGPVCKTAAGLFVRDMVGFEGAGKTYSQIFKRPNRAPDKTLEMQTSPFLAQLYRLNGDYNPLHVDPSIATKVGFQAPILHGLCTFGHAARAVIEACADNNGALFKAIKVRFATPVYPGETFVCEMWDEAEGSTKDIRRVQFELMIKERKVAALSSCYVELHRQAPQSNL